MADETRTNAHLRQKRPPQVAIEIERSILAANIPVLRLSGKLDIEGAWKVRHAILTLVDEGVVNYIINLTMLDDIDSTGLGALVSGNKRAREKHGRMKTVCTDQRILRLFEITRLSLIFDIYQDEDTAALAFAIMDADSYT